MFLSGLNYTPVRGPVLILERGDHLTLSDSKCGISVSCEGECRIRQGKFLRNPPTG